MQAKADLLKVEHARHQAKRGVAAAEEQLAANRAVRQDLVQRLTAECQARLQQQLQVQQQEGMLRRQCCNMQGCTSEGGSQGRQLPLQDQQPGTTCGAFSSGYSSSDYSTCVAAGQAERPAGCRVGPLPSIGEEGTPRVLAEHNMLGSESALGCVQQLLCMTGCGSVQQLLLQVQAQLRAAVSLHEPAAAAAETLSMCVAVKQLLPSMFTAADDASHEKSASSLHL